MTKRNALVLGGLLAALSLHAKQQPSQPSQPTSDQEGMSWGKKLGIGAAGAAGLGGTLAAGSYAAPSWRDYFLNKGSNALGSAGNVLSSARSSAGNVLSSAGGYASRAWDWGKGLPYAGYDYGQRAASLGWQGLKATPSVAWEGLKATPGTIAGYAATPYIAQGIAQRFPSASVIKDYPTTTNIAATLAAAGAGYGLYKGGQYAADWYSYKDQIQQLAKDYFNSNPYEGLYQKVERLLRQQPFNDPLQNALFHQHIFNLGISAFKQERNVLANQAKAFSAQATSQDEKDPLYNMAQAINQEIKNLDATIKHYQESYDALSQKIKDEQNKASEQAPGYSGWWRGK